MSEHDLRQVLRQAIAEALEDRRHLLHDVLAEVLEDFALSRAVREGLETQQVKRKEVFEALDDTP